MAAKGKKRDYKKEYRDYHSNLHKEKPEQRETRHGA